jgi:hypothetical protein
MNKHACIKLCLWLGAVSALSIAVPSRALAHCDGLDGPVVAAARKALASGDINLALIWVRNADEAEIKAAFERAAAVRKLSAGAQELADLYFFETLVRVHRAGEGAPYTGLKPAGRDLGPAIPAADKALRDGKLEPVAKLLAGTVEATLHERFEDVLARKNFPKEDLRAGRQYVKAYVEYVHYVEGVYNLAKGQTGEHTEEAPASPHQHH